MKAAILHDTVEDTNTTFDEVESKFGPEVRHIVSEVTDDKRLPKLERKQLQIVHAKTSRLAQGSSLLLVIDRSFFTFFFQQNVVLKNFLVSKGLLPVISHYYRKQSENLDNDYRCYNWIILHQYCRGYGFKSCTGLNFLRPNLNYFLSSVHYWKITLKFI